MRDASGFPRFSFGPIGHVLLLWPRDSCHHQFPCGGAFVLGRQCEFGEQLNFH